MLLAIDAGNTNIVFAVHDGHETRAEWRAVTETTRTADEYAVLLQPLLGLHGLSFADLDAAIIATVVPAALFDLRVFCRRYVKCEPLVIGDPDLDLGIGINVDRPDAVGADRLVNTIKASAPVESGHLRDSVRKEPLKQQPGVRIAAGGTAETMDGTFDEAKAVEYGTSKMAAHPYFWSAVDSYGGEFQDAVEKGAADALKDL